MSGSSGNKIKLLDTGRELPLSISPESFQVTKDFQFQTEYALAQEKPRLSFQSGGKKTLELRLQYDQDADESVNAAEVIEFLGDLDKVQKETEAPSPVEFRFGNYAFQGVVESYSFHATRFDRSFNITGMEVIFNLVEIENEQEAN